MALTSLIIATVCTASPAHPQLCAGGLPKNVKTEIVAPAGCNTSSWLGNPNGVWKIPDSCHTEVKVVWRDASGKQVTDRSVDLKHRSPNEAASVTVRAAM